MDDEFKLCWKNFQDNIASGFQSLYDRGDLVDVTLACDGKLLQAHKIVLAICSPYFQEIFITNPCKHPIIILKDVSYTIMCELLEFMYQGVVNVKHTELQAFMKIGQLLQIKGLATNSSSSTSSSMSEKLTTNQNTNADSESPLQRSGSPTKRDISPPSNETEANNESSNNAEKLNLTNADSNTPQRTQSPAMSPASPSLNISSVNQKQGESQMQHNFHLGASGVGHKRHLAEFNSDSLSIYSRNKSRRFTTPTDQSSDNNEGSEVGGNNSMDQMNAEDFFLPHMSMVEGRYDLNSVKRESSDHHLHPNSTSAAAAAAAAASLRSSFNPAAFGLDYTFYKNNNSGSVSSGQEYPNDLNISSSDFSKSFANHMDIPPNCPNVVMLSSTSLLHGHCVFNRNNTVATQQGMKTYWLCKSYRISMCRARCITHQGKIISATGVHNHPPHMRGNNNGSGGPPVTTGPHSDVNMTHSNGLPPPTPTSLPTSARFSQNMGSPSANIYQPNYHGPPTHHGHPISPVTPPSSIQHATISSVDAPGLNPTSSHHYIQSVVSNQGHQHGGGVANQISPPQLHPPTAAPNLQLPHNNVNPVLMHPPTSSHGAYEMSPSTISTDHNRCSNQEMYDVSGKALKAHVNDEHILVQNAAALSPSNLQNESDGGQQTIKTSAEQLSQHHQHQPVQVIDSITISPGGNSHNFKMEPL
uniref:BTB domain-containing protein n=2 Tax=Stomoxys calcitrans TaxID=35570 RepID=A0A1I8PVD6_STOCA